MNAFEVSQLDAPVMALLQSFGLTLVRVSIFVFCVPPFLGRPIPIRLRIGFAAVLAFVAGSANSPAGGTPSAPVHTLVLQEIIVGFALGFATSTVLIAFQIAGGLIGRMSGGSLMSATSESESGSPLTAFYFGAATSLLFLTGAHRIVIDGVLQSFASLPIGAEWSTPNTAVLLGKLMGASFEFAIRVASPVAITLMAASIVTAIVARFVRTFSFFGIGMSLNACLLVGALFVSCVLLPSAFEQHFDAAFEIAAEFLRSIRV